MTESLTRHPGGRPPVIPASVIAQVRSLAALGWSFGAIARQLRIDPAYVGRIVRKTARKAVT